MDVCVKQLLFSKRTMSNHRSKRVPERGKEKWQWQGEAAFLSWKGCCAYARQRNAGS